MAHRASGGGNLAANACNPCVPYKCPEALKSKAPGISAPSCRWHGIARPASSTVAFNMATPRSCRVARGVQDRDGSAEGVGPRLVQTVTDPITVSYTHLRAHETRHELVCRLLL